MKILLLQEQNYFPSLSGASKANRLLLEGLARRRHECAVICPAFNRRARNLSDFLEDMAARGIKVRSPSGGLFFYRHNRVEVEGIDLRSLSERREYLIRRLHALNPDRVLVSDDPRGYILESALAASPDRVVFLVHNNTHLPFGPAAVEASQRRTELMRQVSAFVVASQYSRAYLQTHAGLASAHIPFPAYGDGPFPMSARFDRGFVTLINPCAIKGLSIFLGLARALPEVEFAAVTSWGNNEEELRALSAQPNVTLLRSSEDIDGIFSQTKILLVPSLVPEAFGLVAPEAMLRGIPVLASDLGGLREAKLGVDYLLPVLPAQRCSTGFAAPEQDLAPWLKALRELLSRPDQYQHCSQASREAALQFVASTSAAAFEEFLFGIDQRRCDDHSQSGKA